MNKKSVCIITARGGSKRIPRKNIKEFCGKPIIAYSIEAALKSNLFDEVMVSTDDEEITEIAKKYGAAVPFLRSNKNSNDFATTKDVLLEVIEDYEIRGKKIESLCCLYPTAPFVTAEKLQEASKLFDSDTDTVLTVTKFSFPPQRGLIQGRDGFEYWMPENANTRSQDLVPVFHDAGQFYFCKVSSLKTSFSLLGPITKGYEVPELEVQDIDNYSDWEIAEVKFNRMRAAHESLT